MEELKLLLKNYVILKEDNKELYYVIKDNYKYFKEFLREKLGYNLILRGDFVRVEMIPGKVESWMGIQEFSSQVEYTMLMLILIFLEDKNKEDQFLLSHITEAIGSNDIGLKLDWTDFYTRRSLIKVIKFLIKNKIVTITDGNEEGFAQDTSKEVLFESTGVSKYIVRVLEQSEFEDDNIPISGDSTMVEESERGVLKKNRAYRKLLLSPIVYRGDSTEDYEYIKNNRRYIEADFQKYLGWNLHVHRNGAMLVPHEKDTGFYLFPNGKGVSDVMLLVIKELRHQINTVELKVNEEDIAQINKVDLEQLILKVKIEKSQGWSKEYREMSDGKIFKETMDELERFSFIRIEEEKISIMPLCGKVTGDYPEDYQWEVGFEG